MYTFKYSVFQLISSGFILIAFIFPFAVRWESTDALDEYELQQRLCQKTIDIKGAGQVMIAADDGRRPLLKEKTNQLSLPCGSLITLDAQPSARWRFDHWQGVEEIERFQQRISVVDPARVTAVFVPRAVTYETVDSPYYDRDGNLVNQVERLEPIWRLPGKSNFATTNAAPEIDVWYGQTQNFGQNGTPQQWVNILGNVRDPDGVMLKSFSYRLNQGSPRTLSYGGSGSLNDSRRLINPGDFNIDINKDDLLPLPNTNTVVITAVDSEGAKIEFTETIRYDAAHFSGSCEQHQIPRSDHPPYTESAGK